ncbi:hypothetical protein D9M72_605550 [compost metagenome]
MSPFDFSSSAINLTTFSLSAISSSDTEVFSAIAASNLVFRAARSFIADSLSLTSSVSVDFASLLILYM